MGNIVSDGTVAKMDYVDPLIKLSGEFSIVGRAVVVHSGTDDLGEGGFDDSKTTGHAGGRLGCGVIGLSSPFWFYIWFWNTVQLKKFYSIIKKFLF